MNISNSFSFKPTISFKADNNDSGIKEKNDSGEQGLGGVRLSGTQELGSTSKVIKGDTIRNLIKLLGVFNSYALSQLEASKTAEAHVSDLIVTSSEKNDILAQLRDYKATLETLDKIIPAEVEINGKPTVITDLVELAGYYISGELDGATKINMDQFLADIGVTADDLINSDIDYLDPENGLHLAELIIEKLFEPLKELFSELGITSSDFSAVEINNLEQLDEIIENTLATLENAMVSGTNPPELTMRINAGFTAVQTLITGANTAFNLSKEINRDIR